MGTLSIQFNDDLSMYDKYLTTSLFPLIARVLEDCRDGAPIVIPFTRAQFDGLVCEIMRYLRGNIDTLQKNELYEFLLCEVAEAPNSDMMEYFFAQNEYIELLKLRFKLCPRANKADVCRGFAGIGNLELLKWAYSCGCPLDAQASTDAACGGYLEVLKWLHANGCHICLTAHVAAAAHGHVDVLEWMYLVECETVLGAGSAKLPLLDLCVIHEVCLMEAAMNGHLSVLQWFYSIGMLPSEYMCVAAAHHGHLDALRWMHSIGCSLSARIFHYAIEGNQSATLEWLLANGCPIDADGCLVAAKNGCLEALKLLISRGFAWDPLRACYLAMEGKHVEVVRFIRITCNCSMDVILCFGMTPGEASKWLRKQGYPEKFGLCEFAIARGNFAMLEWAHSHGHRFGELTCLMAAQYCQLAMLKWLRANGCAWDKSDILCANISGVIRKWVSIQPY